MNYILYDNENKIITYDPSKQCNDCFQQNKPANNIKIKCPVYSCYKRLATRTEQLGWFGLCSDYEDDLKSNKIFRLRVESFKFVFNRMVNKINDIDKKSETTRKNLLHNLTKINAHCIQELYDLIPQDTLTKNINQQIQTVQEIIRISPQEVSKTILRIMKNNLAMKIEFNTMRFLRDDYIPPELQKHQIRKVVLNILHAFFQDFTEKHVHVNVNNSTTYALIDYNSFTVAIYHIIDNASKYVLPKTDMHVQFIENDGKVKIIFDMISLAITPDELPLIGSEGFSGRISKKLKIAGDGFGMFRAMKLLIPNNAGLTIKPNVDPSKTKMYDNVLYQQNQIIIDVCTA